MHQKNNEIVATLGFNTLSDARKFMETNPQYEYQLSLDDNYNSLIKGDYKLTLVVIDL